MILCTIRQVDMKSRSEVWAAIDSRLDELLTQMRDRTASQCVSTMQGLTVIFHLAALCSKHCLNGSQRYGFI